MHTISFISCPGWSRSSGSFDQTLSDSVSKRKIEETISCLDDARQALDIVREAHRQAQANLTTTVDTTLLHAFGEQNGLVVDVLTPTTSILLSSSKTGIERCLSRPSSIFRPTFPARLRSLGLREAFSTWSHVLHDHVGNISSLAMPL